VAPQNLSKLEEIPIIDFGGFAEGDVANQQNVAQTIYDACHNVGFLYLQNHGIAGELLDRIFQQSQAFFALPLDRKQELAWSSEFSNRGYVGLKRERLNPQRPGDAKECFNIGKENIGKENIGKEVENDASLNTELMQNLWIPGDEVFRKTALEFFDACTHMANQVFCAFAMALNLPESFMVDHHQTQDHTLRLLHYPPMVQSLEPDQMRAGEHSDYGSLTLLFQDDVGGLEIQTADGDWLFAPCTPDTILVNTGDLMQRWSNDVFRSTKHRVGVPTDDRCQRSRYSIAFFCQPDADAEITCIDSCQSETNPPRYPPVLAGDYLISLLRATY
jgi:isopenicillin N synthase-like dioxygenase